MTEIVQFDPDMPLGAALDAENAFEDFKNVIDRYPRTIFCITEGDESLQINKQEPSAPPRFTVKAYCNHGTNFTNRGVKVVYGYGEVYKIIKAWFIAVKSSGTHELDFNRSRAVPTYQVNTVLSIERED